MKSALIHDWLISPVGGAEKVLEAMHRLFPSPIYTLLQDKSKFHASPFETADIHTSFLQKWPWALSKYRSYLPFFPLAIEQFDLSRYDLILSSSHCVAKGVLARPNQLHICYCHTPMRYAWDLTHNYLKEAKLDRGLKGFIARAALHYLRGWDAQSASRVDYFIANSRYVARRIEKFYGRKADVIYPPVDTHFYRPSSETKGDYYLTASRMVPYKKIPLIAEAFSGMKDKKLRIIGDGPDWKRVASKAGPNIELLGYQPNEALRQELQHAKAFVFAADEDFGILPIEAMACGTPVIALRKGGVQETVQDKMTGIFFDEPSTDAIVAAVKQFEEISIAPQACRARAEMFSQENFNRQYREFVLDKYRSFNRK